MQLVNPTPGVNYWLYMVKFDLIAFAFVKRKVDIILSG